MRHSALLPVLLTICVVIFSCPRASGQVLEGVDGDFSRLDFRPFYLETDVGRTERDRQQFGARYARTISQNLDFFLRAFSMQAKDFEDFARFYGAEQGRFDPWIRIRLWRRFEPFLEDLHTRYETQAIAGGYKGTITPRDEYGEVSGPTFREIATYVEGQSDEAILQIIYHELGHLFMQTFMLYPVEVPSWLEEGTAQLFQYRIGNGTNPEPERLERLAWTYESITHDHPFGKVLPLRDMITVRNMDNLDFTYQNPLRSVQQYMQVWLLSEFFIGDRARAQAYFRMLSAMKASSKARLEQLWANNVRGDRLWNTLRMHLYDVQLDIFREAYGRDLFDVEELWKTWVQQELNRQLRRSPILRYHRGTWHLDRRARFAPNPETREQALTTAEAIFKEAVELLPRDPAGYVGLARLAMARGNEELAREHFATATRLGSDFFEALVFGGEALIRTGSAAEAIPGLEKALAERPSHWEATSFLGQALIITGQDVRRGIDLLRSAVTQRQGQVQLRVYQGIGHYLLGDYNAAAQNFADVFVTGGNQDWFTAAACAIARSRQMDDEETLRWIGFVRRSNSEAANYLHERLITRKEAIPLGFTPEGRPAIVGMTVPPEDAIIPVSQAVPENPRRRR
ncbi:MAG: hypothetical protein EA402_05905 [Planctomycetota bacterium]|nr:MAG: hypothetical protein EA402_05905 [Planctomycetota bacterium]